jgi:predicted DCC family thiol-disulfide oxidoreductase YuxK
MTSQGSVSSLSQMSVKSLDPSVLYLIYDGDCLLCKHTAWALRIKQQVKELVLINAREQHPLVQYSQECGFDLNEGMLVFYAGKVSHGTVAFQQLAGLVEPKGLFNRLLSGMFKHRFWAVVCYPFFRLLRGLFLWVRGKKAL